MAISADHYLAPLGLEPPALRGGAKAHRELFAAVVAYLREQDLVVGATGPAATDPSELNLMLPGTSVHVSVSALTDIHLRELVGLAAYFEVVEEPKSAITLAGLTALWKLFTHLKVEYGERSVVEATMDLDRPTTEEVLNELHGRRCRHPGKGCRYEADGYCEIDAQSVHETLEALAAKHVLRKRTQVTPVEWAVAR